ncbi:hypothetical protein WDW37_14295 [Bdellovibrionota bacterium FG-1]
MRFLLVLWVLYGVMLTPNAMAGDSDPAFLSLPAYDLERVSIPQPSPSPGSSKIRVGDSLLMSLRGPGLNPGMTVQPPSGSESLMDLGWDVARDGDASANQSPGELRLKVTPLKGGKLTIPSMVILKEGEPLDKAFARTNPLVMDVESSIKADDPKAQEPVGLRPPLGLRFPWWVVGALILLLAVLVVLAVLVYRRFSRAKQKPAPARPPEPVRPADEVALAALAELERTGPLKRGDFKGHYFRVSEILKVYLAERFRIDAVESTSREIIIALEQRHTIVDDSLDRLDLLFGKLDLVKFTDHIPIPDEGARLLGEAREFVIITRIKSAPPGGPLS